MLLLNLTLGEDSLMGARSIGAKGNDILTPHKSSVLKALLPLLVDIAIALVPHPSGLTPMHHICSRCFQRLS